MVMNMAGANIPYPYDVPNLTQDDGRLGIWALMGASEAVQEQMNTTKTTKDIDAGSAGDDEAYASES